MLDQPVEEAQPLQELLEPETLEIVGYLYQWNNGRLAIMWNDQRHTTYTVGRMIGDLSAHARLNYRKFLSGVLAVYHKK